eukprot:jgi/Mesvir1/9344/Mv01036-RA.1
MSTRLMDVEVEDEADYATESAPAVRGGFLDAVDLVDEDDNPVETRALPDPSQFRSTDRPAAGSGAYASAGRKARSGANARTGPRAEPKEAALEMLANPRKHRSERGTHRRRVRGSPAATPAGAGGQDRPPSAQGRARGDAPYVMKGPSLGGFAIGSMMPPVPVAPRAPPPPPPDMDQLVHEAMSPMARPEMAVIDIYDDDGESVADSFAGVGGSADASGGGDLRTVQVTDKKSRRRGGKKKDADANKLVLDI